MMFYTALFIRDHGAEIYIFHTPENISFHKRIGLFHFLNQLLNLLTFGFIASITVTGRTGIRKPAGTLNKPEVIIISPFLNAVLPDKI